MVRTLKINELKDGMKRVDVEGNIIEKSDAREVMSRYKEEVYRVATAVISDGTGTIKLTLWGDQIDKVTVNNTVKIENGYISTFRGEMQLNVGRYGKLSIV